MVQAAVKSANSVDQSGDKPWVGRSIERVEDAALLSGRGRFIDDLGVQPGTLHATILRSPHAHADIISIDAEAARAAAGRCSGPDWRADQGGHH
ncbi:xanthine dehydrogenase molybdopterin-binding subunit B [Bradyrhizobium ottawaense]